ncbi:MAG: TIGR01777 family oxidoreductase [Actinomycetota bacterium]
MDVAITGSSGLIGTALSAALTEAGHRPIGMVRRDPKPGRDEIAWKPSAGTIDAESLEGIDAVVNLAGAGIGDKRWSESYRGLVVSSRVDSTALLAATLAELDRPPAALLSGSAVGYYGSRGDAISTEETPAADDFLAQLCVDWEAAAKPAAEAGIRTVYLRTGVVQSTAGGALGKLLPLFKLGVGGKFGSGDQYIPWITIDDVTGAILYLLNNEIEGPVNLTAPNPATNAEYTSTLARVLGRPSLLPVPAFGPKLLMGTDRADALLFDSLRVVPQVLEQSDFEFRSPELEAGLRAVLGH